LSTGAIAAGLALFLGVAHPGLGHPHASITGWMTLTSVVVVGCGALVLAARGASRRWAAVLLAVGSGAAFGYVAALTERTGHLLNDGVVHTLSTWEPYALAIGAVGALLLTQSAFSRRSTAPVTPYPDGGAALGGRVASASGSSMNTSTLAGWHPRWRFSGWF